MNKPIATLGDALAAKDADWRAQLRANDVQRRPPPSSSKGAPDRGYVEQPNERRLEQPQRPRIETPKPAAPVAIIRPIVAQQAPEPPKQEAAPEPAVSPVEQKRPSSPPPLPEGVKKFGVDGRRIYTLEFKAKVAAAFLDAQSQTPPATQRAIADQFGVEHSLVGLWVRHARDAAAKEEAAEKRRARRAEAKAKSQENIAAEKTLLSRPQPPTRTLEQVATELAEAKRRVAELKEEMLGLLR